MEAKFIDEKVFNVEGWIIESVVKLEEIRDLINEKENREDARSFELINEISANISEAVCNLAEYAGWYLTLKIIG